MNSYKLQASFGQVIRSQRSKQGFSQESFADAVGFHRTYIGAVERGEQNISLQNLVKISVTLGIPLSQLIALAEAKLELDANGNQV